MSQALYQSLVYHTFTTLLFEIKKYCCWYHSSKSSCQLPPNSKQGFAVLRLWCKVVTTKLTATMGTTKCWDKASNSYKDIPCLQIILSYNKIMGGIKTLVYKNILRISRYLQKECTEFYHHSSVNMTDPGVKYYLCYPFLVI